ncbi:MAG: Ig-like domain-containing protein [Firmicutes bacterium]|nr:Ig-like domain-containing protein [Bacillota bacterium]
MGKVICDVCGTAYPETAAQCPICGSAKSPAAQAVSTDGDPRNGEGGTTYTSVKGGRFSKKNVKKHTTAQKKESERRPVETPPAERRPAPERRKEKDSQGSNKGLVIVVILLLLAIVMVVVYIGVRVFLDDSLNTTNPNDASDPVGTSSTESTPTTERIACTEIVLSNKIIELEKDTDRWMLSVECTPADTTDTVVFTSADESVATVDQNGLITPVGGGETVITVTCGDVSAECTVSCTFAPAATTDPTGSSATAPEGFVLTLNRDDFTLSSQGQTWTLYQTTDGVKASDITWSSDDPSVATVENGVVTGVGYGYTTIRATYDGQTATCIVRCSFTATETTGNSGIKISHTDVTLSVGETFSLSLTDSEGAKVQDIEWEISAEGYVEMNGSRVTGVAPTGSTILTISTTYEDVTYTCIVRVKEAAESDT